MPSWKGLAWAGGALILAGSVLFAGRSPPPQPRFPVQQAPSARVRYADARMLPGGGFPVESVLNVQSRMRYGEFIWDDVGVPDGPIWIRVDRTAQIISVFRGPHEIGTAVILYGAPQNPTPSGQYPVLKKLRDYRSKTYDADMPFTLWLRDDGIAIHASDVRQGYATHGCVGLPAKFAERLFDSASVGDEVTIL